MPPVIKKLFLLLLVLFTETSALCQALPDFHKTYVPLVSKGPLPAELSKSGAQQLKEKLATVSPMQPDRKIVEEFYSDCIFGEEESQKSGSVLHNTIINNYIDRIADVILRSNPELRRQLKFFPIKENESNAWTYYNGHIYISLDYIACLNSEAQIASVLCHEISHFVHQHAYKRYVKRHEILKNMKEYNRDSLWKNVRNFSKLLESEADLEGARLYKPSGYNLKEAINEFDLMMLCDYSFENKPFNTDYFNKGAFRLNENIFYRDVKPIHVDEKYDDTWHTHPNVYKRKQAIEEEFGKDNLVGGKDFIVSRDTFEVVKDICRFETARIDTRDFDLGTSAYHAYCLLQKYPDNDYLKRIMANSFYQGAVYKSFSRMHMGFFSYLSIRDNVKQNSDLDSLMGHVSQFTKMFRRLSGEDFTLLAINYYYPMYKASGFQDTECKARLDTLFDVLHKVHNFNYRDFQKSAAEKEKAAEDQYAYQRNFVDAIDRKTAFLNYIDDPDFKSFFKDTVSTNEFEIKYISKGKTGKSLETTPAERLANSKNIIVNKAEIKKVKRVLMMEPAFEKYIYKTNDIVELPLEALENAKVYGEKMVKELNENGYEVICPNDQIFSENDIDKYNMVDLVNDVFSEAEEHYSSPRTEVFDARRTVPVADKYQTPYAMRAAVSQVIYDHVKFMINGFTFHKDVKTYEYTMEIINMTTGCIVYHHSFERNGNLTDIDIRSLVVQDVDNIALLKQ